MAVIWVKCLQKKNMASKRKQRNVLSINNILSFFSFIFLLSISLFVSPACIVFNQEWVINFHLACIVFQHNYNFRVVIWRVVAFSLLFEMPGREIQSNLGQTYLCKKKPCKNAKITSMIFIFVYRWAPWLTGHHRRTVDMSSGRWIARFLASPLKSSTKKLYPIHLIKIIS